MDWIDAAAYCRDNPGKHVIDRAGVPCRITNGECEIGTKDRSAWVTNSYAFSKLGEPYRRQDDDHETK